MVNVMDTAIHALLSSSRLDEWQDTAKLKVEAIASTCLYLCLLTEMKRNHGKQAENKIIFQNGGKA